MESIARNNVLITSGGGFVGLTIIKGLKKSENVNIVLADCYEENVSKYFVNSFYKVSKVKEKDEFISNLLEICKKESIDLIIPAMDYELKVLSENIELFNSIGVKVAVSELEILKIILNKKKLSIFLNSESLPVLEQISPGEHNFSFQLIGKPLEGSGSKGIIHLNSKTDLKNIDVNNYVWQKMLENFEEYSIDFAINSCAKPSDFVIRRRISTTGGYAVISEEVQDKKAETIAKNLISLILSRGARGIFNLQILKDTDNNYYISDLNPRIGTSAVFSYGKNINLPLFLLDSGIINKNTKNFKMVRYLEETWIEKRDLKNIKGIVFDLDDTLIDQKQWIFGKLKVLWERFSKELPGKQMFLMEALKEIEEGNRSKLFDTLCLNFGFKDEFKNILINNYREIIPEKLTVFSDAITALKHLRKNGYKLALLTDNPPQSQKQKISAHNLEKVFDEIIFSREMSNLEKPSREVFIETSKRLALSPGQLAMVGDNLYRDIIGSLRADFHHAFLIKRDGCFFNFNEEFMDFHQENYQYTKIKSLNELLFYF